MVGYLYRLQSGRERRLPGWIWNWLPLRAEPVTVHGLHLLGVGLPPGGSIRGLDRGAKVLRKKGCARVLAAPELRCIGLTDILRARGLSLVDPLPLCRAKAPELALALVEKLPLRRRCVALRGENAGDAWAAAAALCPQVGNLLLDFERGEEGLARRLREVYGAAALQLDQGPKPQASVEFSPRDKEVGKTLRLWGKPGLAGVEITAGGVDDLPLLALLWETGRLSLENITVQWDE